MTHKIAILGDFNTNYSTHHALNDGAQHANRFLNEPIQCDWIGTDSFDSKAAFDNLYSGLWIAPGSPYKNMVNVLAAIRYARINNIPTLGNCGGFQHMIIEFARNVCGIKNADHEETNPGAEDLIISKLSCSLVRQEEQLSITDTNSLMYRIIGKTDFKGRYFCGYGVNKTYLTKLSNHGCTFTTLSSEGEVRAFELKSHLFFLGTLFQPALTSSEDEPDPIIIEFFRNCITKTPRLKQEVVIP